MDAVIFATKRAHLAGQRFGRVVLKGFALTPARFDLMFLLRGASVGVRQCELWRKLGVVRSAVSELVSVLVRVGFVRRWRDANDRRTWVVLLTQRGKEVFDRAHARWVDSGDVTVLVDAAMCGRAVEIDATYERYERVGKCLAFAAALGTVGGDLYLWDYEDFYWAFADPDEESEERAVPFMRDLDSLPSSLLPQ